jgi:enamine deaminase RidA (YjgF/YER057c/UK114 family)
MSLKEIQPEGWAPALGYANGMLAEDGTLHVGGQIGWNENKEFVAKDFIGQMEQTLRNIVAIVEAAGGQVSDIARLTWYVKDKSDYLAKQREVGQAYRKIFGRHYPAMAMLIINDLVEDEALIEIEATAHISKKT